MSPAIEIAGMGCITHGKEMHLRGLVPNDQYKLT